MSETIEFSTFLSGLDWNQLLDRMAKLAHSERAKSLCYGLKSAGSLQESRDLLETVKDAIETLAVEEMPWLVSLDQIPPLMEKLSKQGVAEPRELKELRQFLMASQNVREVLRQFQNKWCKTQLQMLSDFKNQISAIERVITEGGDIKEDASEKLWSLCEERRRLERSVKTTLDQVVKRRVMESILQDKYVTTREGRWVLPVKSGNQHDLKGIIHDTSQTKQTVFMEPEEVVPINNRLREVEAEIHEEIHRILTELSQYLFKFLAEFKNSERTCLNADFTWAKARLSAALNSHIPVLTENVLDLRNLRHPLLILQGEDVVANSVVLDPKKRILLLSGPNAGGKTILLKGIGILALMARCGLPIPADEGSQIPFFKIVDPVVGDLQSVGDHLSSFSAHIQRLNQCLNYKGMSTLVLIDEIAGSTDPEEGSALARSFIENFSEQKIFCVVTSHLGPLKESWEKDSGVVHGSLEFDMKNNQPTYRLLQGIPGRSLALAVAKRFGVPEHILKRAQSHLSPDGKARVQNLEEIEHLKEQIMSMRGDAEKAHKEAFDLKDQYMKLVTRFREQRDRWFERALEKTEKKIDNILTEARTPGESTKSVHDIKADLPEIIKGKPLKPRPATAEDFVKQFPSGTPAYSSRLGRQVIVQGQPDNKGNVFVMADLMRLQMPWSQLMPLDSSANPASNQKGRTVLQSSGKLFGGSHTPFQSGGVSDQEEVLDLRGYRVDEAIESLEKWIDDCVRAQLDRVKIIHGFGTETLKKAVRQNLTRNRQVEKWNAGDQNSGGDGITWVQIKSG